MLATILWQSQSGNPGWYLVVMLCVGVISVFLNWKSGEKAAGRAEGAVTATLEAHKESVRVSLANLDNKIDGVEKGLKEDVSRIDAEQIRQWDSIGLQGRELAAVKGRLGVNGKAAGA
jgi:hypothetical protein